MSSKVKIHFKKIVVACTMLFVLSCGVDVPNDVALAYDQLPETIDFNFHVRPILSDRCFACHGPDKNTRKADLRLDIETAAFTKLSSGNYAFVAGNTRKSESIQRMFTDDPEMAMPPPDSHLTLSAVEKATVLKWIEQGAAWKEHWAFIKPETPDVPGIAEKDWVSYNTIDNFVQNKLIEKDLSPSKEANKQRLLRRVTMDLTGLPPTIAEIESFLNDSSDKAYERVVDRLLSSDAYAERLTLDWMDVSRYADSHGLHADGWRLMWPWRDWVIKSFQQNLPYDQFVTWQLAGDLLPNANKEQKLATAFNRNHPMTAEGGVIEEEFRLNYVWDRLETVGTAFLGLTTNCARCHDHKFDPLSQKDYFQMAAFFNNVKELGMTGDDGNYGPMLGLPTTATETELSSLDEKIKKKEEELSLTKKELSALNKYIAKLPGSFKEEGLIGHYPLDAIKQKANTFLADGNQKATSSKAQNLVKGVDGNAFEFTGEYDELYLRDLPNFEWTDSFSASLWAKTTKKEAGQTQTLLGTSGLKNNFWRGWDFYLDSLNHINARLINSLPHNYIHVRSKDSIPLNQWHHLAFTYKGSGKAKDLSLFINGQKIEVTLAFDKLYKSIKAVASSSHVIENRAVMVAKSYRGFTGENGIFKGQLDDIRMYARALSEWEVLTLGKNKEEHTNKELITTHWVNKAPKVKSLERELTGLRSEWLSTMMPVMEVMVMEDMPEKRKAYVYNRGDYEQPMYEVEAMTPEALPEFPEDYPKNRLGLAQWIFAAENPLSARVTVNRYWQMLFGKGLVDTPHDFGVQGSLPSHPQLLDWLATTFVESGWDIKKLLKTMVMSYTYRQSSNTLEKLSEIDPTNNYLARSNSYRLPAEMIRDNALAASGLLVKHVGGKSVKPYQPGKLWIEKNSFSHVLLNYIESSGDSLYRRGLYTFIRRTAPHPAMTAFDAPSREVCIIKRENTNTPLQALVLMNDVQFVEASKVLAERMQKEGGETLGDQIKHGFRLAVSRYPKEEETKVLKDLYAKQEERFRGNPKEANALLSVGQKILDGTLDKNKTAALTMVANTILNHDEAYMKR